MVANPQISAGVLVTVSDQSIYAAPNPTTIPLIVFATRANKTAPDGSGTAPGTMERGKLRVVTSQRDLNLNYGNATFVTASGQPVFGDETSEYGLLAAWSFLGIGNQAYVIRAGIDLGEIVPSQNEPTLPPPDGTYWIKSNRVVGGIFKFNGTSWVAVHFHLFTSAPTGGSDGDWGFDYSTMDGTLVYNDSGTWAAATAANLHASYSTAGVLTVQPSAPSSPARGNFWYKTVSSGGGTNLFLSRFRAVDGVFVRQSVIRQNTMPVPNEGTIWEDDRQIASTGARPLYVGTGTQFIQLPFFAQPLQPVSDPDKGTLWYNDDFTDFALYVEGTDVGFGNQWVPVTTVIVRNPSSTQKVIRASAPTFPQEGAIWVDIRTPENLDNFPVIKRMTLGRWIDITRNVVIQDTDPLATAVADGTYWVNTGEALTRFTVKQFNPAYTPSTVVLNMGRYSVQPQTGIHWEPVAGTAFGRKAQRIVVVESLREAINRNDAARAERNYFQLIACPGYPELYQDMLALNTDNGETALVIADPRKFMIPSGIPEGREVTVAEWITNANNVIETGEDGFSGANSPYAAFWFPWCVTTNVDGLLVFAPPSHMALRVIAFSDRVSAPWFPPAGFTRGSVVNAESVGYLNNDGQYVPVQLNRGMRDVAYQNNVNPIADLPNRGLTVFGQKTNRAISSALDRINVARLIAKMKYDLRRLLEPFLFEINDAITQRAAQNVTERYLSGLKSLRALFDYAVRCDGRNNTPDRVDANQLWVDVAIKPAKAVEFIYVPITVLGSGDQLPF